MCLFIHRVDVAHLSLYNLSVIHKKKYFDSDLELMAYINDNWDRLQLGEVWVSSVDCFNESANVNVTLVHLFFCSTSLQTP